MKRGSIQIILLILLIIVSVAFAIYFGTQQKNASLSQEPQNQNYLEEKSPMISTPAPTPVPTSNIPSSWNTYRNEKYSFEISYPSTYKVLDDDNNLYGYPNGIVLIYGGGQSYDLVLEHWSKQSDYENKYRNQPNLTIKKIGNDYISLFNTNFEAEVDEIIKTFKIINFNE